MKIGVSFPYQVDDEWYFGQAFHSDNDEVGRLSEPIYFGPYATLEEAKAARKARIDELEKASLMVKSVGGIQ